LCYIIIVPRENNKIKKENTTMYNVRFTDTIHGEMEENFETYDETMEYWNNYADTESCVAGVMMDLDNCEIIWNFDDREVE